MAKEATEIENNTLSHLVKIEEESQEKLNKIRDFYGLVATESVTGGHKQIADREHDFAKFWRRVAVGSIMTTIAWLVFGLFFYNPPHNSDREFWFAVAKSISLSALMISFAVYASKQAALHRVSERKAREFFLQVQAFDPFIENLNEADRHTLKKDLSARIFAPDDGQHDKAILEHGDFKSLGKLINFAEEASKIFKP